ncbi:MULTISPECIES: ABC transporter ATP-binding protein [unclassified Methylobacterium]|jgi:NitT/TauT family transport system ATP-binding protein|uniref:ABC transporter ATP-binding protein n=1 Tax=unclassified Methylobacterium TaxID=2615210 RepID=UPI000689C3AC|nr:MULTISPECIES: ABC transporter ATP-binding protein [unclassified Methylobacterium]SFU97167.1 NitT/TauT family transport system ATP-binding protein [Methylobacterium sp. UNCCL125]
MDAALTFADIRQEFFGPDLGSPTRVLDGISFDVGRGEFIAVIGPSGCGKSTLLQMAAGLLKPTAGTVRHRGRSVAGVNREVGFVPQQAQLFPWKTLSENVELPLLLRGVSPAERRTRVADALRAVGLEGFERHYPNQLSGGMQKRGSIARTLIYKPDVILMDEPFGALDAQTRMVMQADLQTLSREAGATVIFITHDITEAVVLADRVVVLSQRPSRVLADVAIDLARPRDVFEPFRNPGFEAAYEAVWSRFRTQIALGSRTH